MPNLQFLANVTHQGVVIPAGAVVSDSERELSSVARDLIDRELAIETTKPTTHTAALAGSDQIAIAHKPAADADDTPVAPTTAAEQVEVPAPANQAAQSELNAKVAEEAANVK